MQPTIKSPPPPALGSSPSGSSPAARADAMRAQFARSTSSAAFASMTNVRGSPSGNWKAAMGQGVISLDAYEAPTVEELKRKIPSSPSAPRPQTASPPVKPLLPASPSLSVGRPLIPSSPTLSRPLGVPPLKVSTTPATPSPSRKEITNSNGTASERALKPEERYKKMLARAMAQEEQDTKTVVLRRRALSEPSFPSWEILNVIEAKDSEKYAPPSSARSDESSRSMSMSDPENSEQSLSEANDISPRESLTAGDSLLLSEDDTGGKSVVAGTVDRLVALLADENAPDKNYVDVMLKTHHYFIESHRLLRLLMDRFRDTAPLPLSTSLPTSLSPSPSLPVHHSHPAHGQRSAPGSPAVSSASSPSSTPSLQSASSTVIAADAKHVYIQIRVVNVIKHWIENEPEDFDDATLRQSLIAHLERLRGQGDKCERWANHLHGLLLARRTPPLRQIPKPLLPKRMTEKHWNGEVSFLDIHPLELARQMTLVEWREFAVIRKREYYHKAWAKGEKEGSTGAAPNIGASIARFNRLSYWIATEVLLTPSPKQRITVLSRFIELAKHLEELNNFNGMMEVLSALNFSFIKRLKSVWKQVPSKLVKIVKKLDDLMDQAGNYRNYRAALQTRVPPVLPFQGVYLTDLTFIEEKPDRLVNGMVNYEKLVLVHKVLSDIQRHQSLPYNFESIECIQEFLKSPGLVLGDEQLWSHSKKCEPSVEAPLTQDSASTVIFNPAPYASTLDQIEEKERVLNKLQRESSDRALAGKMLRENNEKKEKKDKAAQASRAKEPAKKPRSAMASSLSAVTNILAVPSVSTSPPTVPALTSSPSLGVMPMRRAGSTSGEPAPHGPAPPQPKSPKHGVAATAPRPALVASSSDSMHMVQQRRLEREKERGSPVRAQHAGSPTPPVPQVRKEAETRERSASTSSDMSNSSSSMTTDRSGGSGKDKDKDSRDSKEKEKKEKHHRHHTREK